MRYHSDAKPGDRHGHYLRTVADEVREANKPAEERLRSQDEDLEQSSAHRFSSGRWCFFGCRHLFPGVIAVTAERPEQFH